MKEDIIRTELLDEDQALRVRQLLARSAIYRTLALALSYPTEECFQAFRKGWEDARAFLEVLGEEFPVQEIDEIVKTFSREQLEADYVRVFTHIFAPDAQPCETAYTAKNLFQLSDQLSRLTRFYESFGVQPNKERPDHISVELHFMGFLAIREARDLLDGDIEHSEICRNSARAFFQEHLQKYALAFARAVREKGDGTYLSKISKALEKWILAESGRLGVSGATGNANAPVQGMRKLRILQEDHKVML